MLIYNAVEPGAKELICRSLEAGFPSFLFSLVFSPFLMMTPTMRE
jgi:hypothetical protein